MRKTGVQVFPSGPNDLERIQMIDDIRALYIEIIKKNRPINDITRGYLFQPKEERLTIQQWIEEEMKNRRVN